MRVTHEYDRHVAWVLESVNCAPLSSHCVCPSNHLAAEDKDCLGPKRFATCCPAVGEKVSEVTPFPFPLVCVSNQAVGL